MVRATEYRDIERNHHWLHRRVAMIVTEDVTSLLLDVVRSFDGCIPLALIDLAGFALC